VAASQLVWDPGGTTAAFVGWDDDCGTLFQTDLPEAGAWQGIPILDRGGGARDGPSGEVPASPRVSRRLQHEPVCRSHFAAAPGRWLYTHPDEEFSQKLVIAGRDGRDLEAITFPPGRPLRPRWGTACAAGEEAGGPAAGRPPVAGWWRDVESGTGVLFTWRAGAVETWGAFTGTDAAGAAEAAGSDPVATTCAGLLAVAGPPGAGRLLRVASPGAAPEEILPAPVEDVRAAPGGRRAVAVRVEGGFRSLWLVSAEPPETPGGVASGAEGGVE
jgi:hypothetical protein